LTNINNNNDGTSSIHNEKTAASSNNNKGFISTSNIGTILSQSDEKHVAPGNNFEHV
jgi:hypothetical protein